MIKNSKDRLKSQGEVKKKTLKCPMWPEKEEESMSHRTFRTGISLVDSPKFFFLESTNNDEPEPANSETIDYDE